MKANQSTINLAKLDALGIGLSIACGIHCLAAPLLLSMLPIMGMEFIAGEGFETAMIVIIASLVGYVGFKGYQLHKNITVIALFALGLSAFLFLRPFVSEIAEPFVTVAGGLLIVAGHSMNWIASKPCRNCEGG